MYIIIVKQIDSFKHCSCHIFKDIKILFLLNIEINIWNASCTPLPLPNLTPANRDPALLANERPVF
jgi:hypothetical protein